MERNPPPDAARYSLEALADKAAVSARTVRYYVQRGLLPPPVFRGRETTYGEEHLLRLRAIQRLKDRFLPLDAIAAELDRRSLRELEALADGRDTQVEPPQAWPAPRPVVAPISQTQTRYQLAPGLDLTLTDDAPGASRALAERLLLEARRSGNNA
ncbi:MAG: MerR family transcriptional regulator [Acidobacteria bacterium]|nr:MerR family transcriptional regulator [Acidobacteriota bacterium]